MAVRPSFQFYPADWRNNAKLRRCSEAARGIWMDVLCVLHDSDEYGICRWPLEELARAAGAPLKHVKELSQKDVLKGADKNVVAFVHVPKHAGKSLEPVTLIEASEGPCWYSSRFVRDEWQRTRRGMGSRFTTENQPPKDEPIASPTRRMGERQGDGPISSSSSSSADTSLRSVRAKRLPANFPDEEAKESAIAFWRSSKRDDLVERAEAEFGAFRDHHTAHGSTLVDWPAGMRTWARNALKFSKPPAGQKLHEWKPIVLTDEDVN